VSNDTNINPRELEDEQQNQTAYFEDSEIAY
jgi:hypothetical protein